jgi:serine/threonine-protein kinase
VADEVIAGRYRLEKQLGAGGMSAVWRATDEELERTVAVKLLRPDADRARFEREARSVAALSHPNINQLYDYGEVEGRPFMVLEYLPGGSLEELLTYGEPLPDERTGQIAADVAAGLAHAHARGLVHRDLKPPNILFDSEGRAKICDFGIARLGGAGTLTEAGTVLGTAAYISPEQAAGESASPASDVYSFGAILFRMLTGRLPFEAEEPLALVTMHQTHEPPSVADLRPDAPARLEAVTAAALAKDPADRPPDGAALAAELTPVAATLPLAAAPTSTSAATAVLPAATTDVLPTQAREPRRPPRRRIPAPVLAAIVLALAAAGAALAFLVTRSSSNSSPPPTHEPRLTLPTISTSATTSQPSTTQPTTTTEPTTTARTTTHQTTTSPLPTTVPTTIVPTTLPLTTALTTTTEPGPGG